MLLPLAGKTMLQWVHERAKGSRAAEVIIATDDERIANAARGFAAEVAMTARTHVSGTDRIAEVARTRGWADTDIVVNVQGDEPLIPSGHHRPGGASCSPAIRVPISPRWPRASTRPAISPIRTT